MYEERPKQLLEKCKFERAKAAAAVMAECIGTTLPYLSQDVTVVHVPTATSRRRQRGYDQSEEIARHLAAARGLPHRRLLARQGQTRQVGATKQRRAEQMEAAFRAVRPEFVQGKTVLLVDDLTTTGATLESAAKALKQAGAKKLYAATFAQRV